MHFGLHFFMACNQSQSHAQRYRETIEQAVRAEALGFESVWPVEHHFNATIFALSCPSVLLAAIAARTERLRLGTGIVQLPLTHPMRVAEEFASLDVLSEGRVELGIGRSRRKPSALWRFRRADRGESRALRAGAGKHAAAPRGDHAPVAAR